MPVRSPPPANIPPVDMLDSAVHKRIYIYVYTCTYTHIHAYIYTYAHIYEVYIACLYEVPPPADRILPPC